MIDTHTDLTEQPLDNKPIGFKTFKMSKEEEQKYVNSLQLYLEKINKNSIFQPLEYSLKEILENAKKANLKRIYFTEKQLNINNIMDYENGMSLFREEMMGKFEHYENQLEKYNLYVKVFYYIKDDNLFIDVLNNTTILDDEYARIMERIRKAHGIRTLAEAFMQFSDSSESAGLGIITIMLMMRRLGMSDQSFGVFRLEEKGETLTRLRLPLNAITDIQAEELAQKIAAEIDNIPKFPDNILELEKMIRDPEIHFADIAQVIMRDPGMTADLLKIVNSVQFMLPNKVSNINQAVALIGKKGLRDLLYSYGAQKIMNDKYNGMQSFWIHSTKTAFYSYFMARTLRLNNIVEDVYVAGILHDIGKIIINYFTPGLMDKLKNFCAEKGVSISFLEDWSIGISHAKLGAMVARKWLVPENIASAVEFHHTPLLAPDKFRPLVYAVYTADFMLGIEEGTKDFNDFELEVLSGLNIPNIDSFKSLMNKLQKLYQEQEDRFK